MRKISIIVIAAVLAAIVATPAEAVSSSPTRGYSRSWGSGNYRGQSAPIVDSLARLGETGLVVLGETRMNNRNARRDENISATEANSEWAIASQGASDARNMVRDLAGAVRADVASKAPAPQQVGVRIKIINNIDHPIQLYNGDLLICVVAKMSKEDVDVFPNPSDSKGKLTAHWQEMTLAKDGVVVVKEEETDLRCTEAPPFECTVEKKP